MKEFGLEARPWRPQDLIDDLQSLIDEEPDRYQNTRRTTLCMARGYLKEHFGMSDNAPLTLEELREMAGEPVWCSGPWFRGYGIVKIETNEHLNKKWRGRPRLIGTRHDFRTGLAVDFEYDIEKVGLILYRRKPAGGDTR